MADASVAHTIRRIAAEVINDRFESVQLKPFMDLGLHLRVIWRFRAIVAIGLLLACALAFMSYARVSFAHGSPNITYRQSETWQATATVFLTERGFPYGYSSPPTQPVRLPDGSVVTAPQQATVATFVQLAASYAPFVESDEFLAMLAQRTPIRGVVNAAPVVNSHQASLPYITISAFATKPQDAVQLANAASDVFSEYIVRQQNANGVPASNRVRAEILTRARQAVLSVGRKKTTPIVIFLTVLIAAIGLAFVLENLRPRIRSIEPAGQGGPDAVSVRRSA